MLARTFWHPKGFTRSILAIRILVESHLVINQPLENQRSNYLSTQEGRIAFISSVLEMEACQSTAQFGCPDYRDKMSGLATAMAHVIGDRRGAFRDQSEQSAMIRRLIDVAWGFMHGAVKDIPMGTNRMIEAWVISVV